MRRFLSILNAELAILYMDDEWPFYGQFALEICFFMLKRNVKYVSVFCVSVGLCLCGCMPEVDDVFHFHEGEKPEPGHPTTPTTPTTPTDPGGESQRPGGSGGVTPGPDPGEPEDPGSQGGGGAVVSPEVLGIELVSPASGDVRGGYEVRVHGAALDASGIVQFGGIQAPSQTFVNSNVVRAIVPPGKLGCVDVLWHQGEETLTLERGFCYTENVGVKTVTPDVVVAGELSEISLVGNGFDDRTTVYFSDGTRSSGLLDMALSSESRLAGSIVLDEPGQSTLYIVNSTSHAVLKDAVRVLPRLVPEHAEPAVIEVGKQPSVSLSGHGFSEKMHLRIGSAVIEPAFVSSDKVTFAAPILPAGSYDILVYDDYRQYRLEKALHYYASGTKRELYAVSPAFGSVKGGETVRISGVGMTSGATFMFGSKTATSKECTDVSCTVTTPPGLAGVVDVVSGELKIANGYEYIVIPEVMSVEPSSGSAGDTVVLEGTGFGDGLRVYLGGHESSQVRVMSDRKAEVVVPEGSGDVRIRTVQGRADRTSDVVFSYVSPVSVVGVSPDQSVILGGTTVQVFGTGFTPGMTLWLDGVQIEDVTVNAANMITFTAPAHEKGEARLILRCEDGTACAEAGLTYFNPTGINTSASGGVINGQLHVTVLTVDTAVPIPNATVYVGSDLNSAVTATTDENGRVSFFLDDLKGAQIVTACAPEHSCNTLQPINASVITLFLEDWHANDKNSSEQDPPPPPPPSDGDMINPIDVTIEYTPQPAYFTGTVGSFGKEELISSPDLVKAGIVMQSTLSPYAPYYQSGDVYLLLEEGAEYKIQARKGDVALALVCGLYNQLTGTLMPRYIGVKRHQFVYDGVEIVNHLECPIPLNQTQSVKLLDPPLHSGPNVVSGSAYLEFGDEGYIGGFMSGQSETDLVVITNMPPLRDSIADAHFAYSVGAYTNMGYPATVFYEYDTLPSETPLEVGPAAPIPVFVTKPYDDVLSQGVVSWTIEHPQNVDFYSLVMRDYRSSGVVLVNQAYLPGSATSFEFPKVYQWAEDHSSRLYISLTAYKSVREGFDFNRFSTGDTRYNYIHSSANTTLVVYDPETAALYYPQH